VLRGRPLGVGEGVASGICMGGRDCACLEGLLRGDTSFPELVFALGSCSVGDGGFCCGVAPFSCFFCDCGCVGGCCVGCDGGCCVDCVCVDGCGC
jgi:hypothetical protein